MNSQSTNSSPKFKHLISKHKQSPKELKEKMRKNYKEKVKNCRDILLNRFRGSIIENDLCSTLTEIYNSTFDIGEETIIDVDEYQLLEELKAELIQEEYDWLLKEYEKAQLDVDWSLAEDDNNVICPICQKVNFEFKNNSLNCSICKLNVNTFKTAAELKKYILCCIETHGTSCNHDPQFTGIPELNETHIYLICDSCKEMKLIV